MIEDVRKNKFIYLASPYTHDSKDVMANRYREITKVGSKLVSEGHILFCPITQSAALVKHSKEDLGHRWQIWERYDLTVLSRCDEIWVVTMAGWDKSVGVTAEIKFANENNIPVKYLDPKDYL